LGCRRNPEGQTNKLCFSLTSGHGTIELFEFWGWGLGIFCASVVVSIISALVDVSTGLIVLLVGIVVVVSGLAVVVVSGRPVVVVSGRTELVVSGRTVVTVSMVLVWASVHCVVIPLGVVDALPPEEQLPEFT